MSDGHYNNNEIYNTQFLFSSLIQSKKQKVSHLD